MPSLNEYYYPVISLTATDSTNNYLRNLVYSENPEEFTVVTSEYQTSGKGQRGNSWESEKSKNLLFSILLYPSFLPFNSQFLLSEIISISIKEELDQYGNHFSIKWPNDIYWEDQKMGGILIENDLDSSGLQQSVIGTGLNINQTTFKSVPSSAISLKQITGKEHIRHEILNKILNRFIHYYQLLQQEKYKLISEKYHCFLYRKEGYHLYKDRKGYFKGKIVEVKNNGTLILEDELKEQKRYLFKEVSFE